MPWMDLGGTYHSRSEMFKNYVRCPRDGYWRLPVNGKCPKCGQPVEAPK